MNILGDTAKVEEIKVNLVNGDSYLCDGVTVKLRQGTYGLGITFYEHGEMVKEVFYPWQQVAMITTKINT